MSSPRNLSIGRLTAAAFFVAAGAVGADDAPPPWDQLRGPGGSGLAAGCRPPVAIDPAAPAWKVPVPAGHSSPVLWGGRLFLTGVEGGRLVTLAFDTATGKRLWRREAPEVRLEEVHRASSPAAPTPFVDGGGVYVYFGSYGLLAYDHAGAERWRRPLPTPKSLYGVSTSPVGYHDLLFLVLDDDANLEGSRLSRSRVVAFDKADGTTAWETARPLHRSGWSTPTVWVHPGGVEVVVLGNGRAASYDAANGEEAWFVGGFSRETISSPVVGGGLVYLSSSLRGGGADETVDPAPFWAAVLKFDQNGDGKLERSEMQGHFTFPIRPELPVGHPGFGIPLPENERARQRRYDGMMGWVDQDRDGFWSREEFFAKMSGSRGKPRLMAVRPGGRGDIGGSHVAWQVHRNIPEIPSPLFLDGRVYMVRNGGILSAVDAADGKLLYRVRLGESGQYSSSPVAAQGHLYLVSNHGLISVVRAGAEFDLVHQTKLGEETYVTPAFDADAIYIRGAEHLWAFR